MTKKNKNKTILIIGLFLIFLLSIFLKLIPQALEISTGKKIFPLGWDAYLFLNYVNHIIDTGFLTTSYYYTASINNYTVPYGNMPLFSIFASIITIILNLKPITVFTFMGPVITSFNIFLIFIIVKYLFKKNYLAFLGAILAGIYNYALYRGSIPVPDNSWFIFFPLVFFLLLKYIKTNHKKYIIISSLITGVALLWHSSFIILPVFIFIAILLKIKKYKSKKNFFIAISSVFIIILINFYNNNITKLLNILKSLTVKIFNLSEITNNPENQNINNYEFINYKTPNTFEWLNNVNVFFIILIISGLIFIIYDLLIKKNKQKKEYIFLLIYFFITFFILQVLPIFKVVDTYNRGFLWIMTAFIVVIIYCFKFLLTKIKPLLMIAFIGVIIFYSFGHQGRIFNPNLNELEDNGMIWLKNNTNKNAVIISQPAHNNMLPAISFRRILNDPVKNNVYNFFYAEDSEKAIVNLNRLINENKLHKSEFYVYLSEKKLSYQIDNKDWLYRSAWDMNKSIFDDKNIFKKVYINEDVTIYKINKNFLN